MEKREEEVVVPDMWSAARGAAGAGRDLPALAAMEKRIGRWERISAREKERRAGEWKRLGRARKEKGN